MVPERRAQCKACVVCTANANDHSTVIYRVPLITKPCARQWTVREAKDVRVISLNK